MRHAATLSKGRHYHEHVVVLGSHGLEMRSPSSAWPAQSVAPLAPGKVYLHKVKEACQAKRSSRTMLTESPRQTDGHTDRQRAVGNTQ